VVQRQSPERFRMSVRRSRALLEDITGSPVLGFRAPCFSIIPGYEWTFDILIEEGYLYDSSLLPVRRPGFSYPAAARDAHWIERPSGRILEVPPSTVRLFGLDLLGAGGAYFRIFPYEMTRRALQQAAERGQPATFYIHPWELDPGQPRLHVSAVTRLRKLP
jgi:polysaccharide deacetylase family protein (PEP-CTERM system associated)